MSTTVKPLIAETLDPKVNVVITSFGVYMDTPTLTNNTNVKAVADSLLTSFNGGSVIIKPVSPDDITIFGPSNEPREQQQALIGLITDPTAASLARFKAVMDDWARKWNLM